MAKRILSATVLCSFLSWGVTTASAVTIDISSPQAGTIVHPGDTVQINVAIGNDTSNPDIVVVTLRHTLTANGQTHLLGQADRVRLRLAPGKTVTTTLELTIPTQFPTQFTEGVLTIEGVARGLVSNTVARDSVSIGIQNP